MPASDLSRGKTTLSDKITACSSPALKQIEHARELPHILSREGLNPRHHHLVVQQVLLSNEASSVEIHRSVGSLRRTVEQSKVLAKSLLHLLAEVLLADSNLFLRRSIKLR